MSRSSQTFAHIIEEHLHNRERWFGILAIQTATAWADDTLAPFVAISGSDTYGADADDEAQVLGVDDTPTIAGSKYFDIHRVLVVNVDHGTPYKLRLVWGTSTMAAGISAGQITEFPVLFDAVNPQLSAGVPIEIISKRLRCGFHKVWIQAWNATDNSEISFLVGIHEYD